MKKNRSVIFKGFIFVLFLVLTFGLVNFKGKEVHAAVVNADNALMFYRLDKPNTTITTIGVYKTTFQGTFNFYLSNNANFSRVRYIEFEYNVTATSTTVFLNLKVVPTSDILRLNITDIDIPLEYRYIQALSVIRVLTSSTRVPGTYLTPSFYLRPQYVKIKQPLTILNTSYQTPNTYSLNATGTITQPSTSTSISINYLLNATFNFQTLYTINGNNFQRLDSFDNYDNPIPWGDYKPYNTNNFSAIYLDVNGSSNAITSFNLVNTFYSLNGNEYYGLYNLYNIDITSDTAQIPIFNDTQRTIYLYEQEINDIELAFLLNITNIDLTGSTATGILDNNLTNVQDLLPVMFAVSQVPYNFLVNFLDFSIFGVNLFGLLTVVIMVSIVIFIVKKVI